jgi:hypothetical protein
MVRNVQLDVPIADESDGYSTRDLRVAPDDARLLRDISAGIVAVSGGVPMNSSEVVRYILAGIRQGRATLQNG